ncbi:SAM-dependent methyltransferase [Spirosoma sp. BT702]|uniref:SAM-dependent methyltransferase n=1 Tax=Spirosoma profusum TaxID=2771354 RepID=A0A927AS25_9BACT|nr:SAM-dependent methyltransferase [Spirosoma profusum]MBD2703196.1 SAM-dependent methyltransferase [Spirosoma profusum]
MINLSSNEQAFIQENLLSDVHTLLLRAQSTDELAIKKLAAQIKARQKAREKLPTWYATDSLVFPPALSVEQASSEATARYKASLVDGRLLLDLTGGMGVDSWAFAQRIERVVYVDQQPELAELVAHNLPLLGITNVDVHTGDGLALLDDTNLLPKPADWLYLDPHRRNEQGGKVVRLDDCEPDLSQPGLVKKLLNTATKILVKASPLLDINTAVRQLQYVESIHIVAVQGEVKEILFTLGNQIVPESTIKSNAVNLLPEGLVDLSFYRYEEQQATVTFGNPLQYLYEPNAAVLKAGAFRLVAERFCLTKLAPNSHLYTSDTYQPNFPGRVFDVKATIKPDAKTLKTIVPSLQANLTVRNFPQTVAALRKQLNLREGGSIYIFATTLLNGDKRLLITQKTDFTSP